MGPLTWGYWHAMTWPLDGRRRWFRWQGVILRLSRAGGGRDDRLTGRRGTT